MVGSGALGFSSKGSVVGETSAASVAEEIPEAEWQAQTVLIRAAKQEVTTPTPDHLAALSAAHAGTCRGAELVAIVDARGNTLNHDRRRRRA